MIYQAIGIGILVSFAFYEIVGFSPGGFVVPGYIALFLDQPARLLITLLIALLTYFAINILSNYIILYGRRRFFFAIIIGFLLKWFIEKIIVQVPISGVDLRGIGYIIPGLIANEMKRQGIFPTFYSLVIVSMIVYLILLLFI